MRIIICFSLTLLGAQTFLCLILTMKIVTPAVILSLVILIESFFIINDNNRALNFYILCGYMVLGGSIKYIDEVYDESIFNKRLHYS